MSVYSCDEWLFVIFALCEAWRFFLDGMGVFFLSDTTTGIFGYLTQRKGIGKGYVMATDLIGLCRDGD